MADRPTVLITGASKGIGAAAARRFAAAGWAVALVARSTTATADLAGEIGAAALAIPCDVARPHEMQAAVGATLEAFGRLDALVLNAGVVEPIAPLGAADPEAWGQAVSVNLVGVHNGLHAALPALGEGATVILVSSGAAHRPVEGWSAYCASKAGAWMLLRSVALERPGLRAFGLSPGTVATDMQRVIKASGIGPVAALDWEDHVPAEWPAEALLWLTTEAADDLRGTEVSLRDEAVRARIGL